jgi:hypothetical protein
MTTVSDLGVFPKGILKFQAAYFPLLPVILMNAIIDMEIA